MSTERLLREYVREVLKEDDGGVYGDLANANAAMSPYGMTYGSGDELYKVFVKPFMDVVDTTMGKTKELSQRTQTLVKVAFETIATTLIPIFTDSYKEIFAKEKQELDKIKQEFGEVYQSNIDAFRDNDVFWTAFCYAPAAIITHQLAKRSPQVAVKMISSLTGGSMDDFLKRVLGKFGGKEAPPKTGLDYHGSSPSGGGGGGNWLGYDSGGGGSHSGTTEGVIREDGEEKKQPDIGSVLTNPKLLAKIEESDIVKKMRQEAQGVVRGTLETIYKQASAVMKANSLQDLQHSTGKTVKGVEKLAALPPQEKQKAEQAILKTFKQSMKSFYLKNLESQVKQATSAGVAENSPYVQDYTKIIAKIKAL